MRRQFYLDLAKRILAGEDLKPDLASKFMALPDADVFSLIAGADILREASFGRSVRLCSICNAKSGKCPEDCAFCAQSVNSDCELETYPLLANSELGKGARYAAEHGINRYSLVASGKGVSRSEVRRMADAYRQMDDGDGQVAFCASLGILEDEDFAILREAGVTRYHHNLETAESNFANICTTHAFADRIETVRRAKSAGMSVCCGGMFGIGESDDQIVEFALTLRDLDVDSIPLNFLMPIKGTPLGDADQLTPLRCLKIIALFRYMVPDKEILIGGGRVHNLHELHPLVFHAGASGILTGNYLTNAGRDVEDDLQMINDLGFSLIY